MNLPNDHVLLAFALLGGSLAIFIFVMVLFSLLNIRREAEPVRAKGSRMRMYALMGMVVAAFIAHSGGIWALLVAAGVGAAAGYLLPRALSRMRGNRLQKDREKQIPASLDLLANGMRSGMSFIQAWTFASQQTPEPFGADMANTLNEIQLGRPMEEALENLRRRVDSEDMDLTVASIRLTLATGGDLPKGLATIAGTIRSRAMMRGKIDALTSQGRLQALLVAGIPLIMVFVTYAVDPERTALLWTTTYGWILMAVLAIMDIIGFFAIQWICTIKI